MSLSNVSPLIQFWRWQQEQRWRRRTSATISSLRSVAIEVGLCRSGHTGSSAGSATPGNSRCVESRLISNSLRGKKAALGDQESVGGDAQGRVVMKAAPFTTLVMSKPDLLFEFLVVAFDPPPQSGNIDQFLQRGPGRQRREPILGRRTLAFGPFDQQPLFSTWGTSQIIAMCRTDTDGGKARAQFSARAFAPSDLAELLGSQAESQLFDCHRLMVFIASQPRRFAPKTTVRLR